MNVISFKTKFGWISISEKQAKILSISFKKKNNKGRSKYLGLLKSNVNDYFDKKNKKINTNILLEGSDLQIKIWKELRKIPYGKTKSYADIAKIVKTSPRYVGNVCSKNKHLLIIPCHRVIKSDGTLGGFSGPGGLTLKKRLLKLEEKTL